MKIIRINLNTFQFRINSRCKESQCIFERDSIVTGIENLTNCKEHKDCFGLKQDILQKNPLKLAANYMCFEGICHGVPHFVHDNGVCSRKKDCKYHYKCFLHKLRGEKNNVQNNCFCDGGACEIKLHGEKVQQKQRKKSCHFHTETKKVNNKRINNYYLDIFLERSDI